jgi:hypothetical protein
MRIRWNTSVGVALLMLAVAGAAAAQDVPPPTEEDTGLLVVGSVVDVREGTAVPQSIVRLFLLDPLRPAPFREDLTSQDGRFRLLQVPPGRYRLHVQALGYRILSEEIDIPNLQPVEIRIELVSEALEIDPIIITSASRRSLEREGFFERRRMNLGTIYTRNEILERAGADVSDVLRHLAGVSLEPLGRGAEGVDVRFRGGCVPDIIVDGVETIPGIPLDQLVSLHEIEAIEIYMGSTAPSRFQRSPCGAIVAWTRDPGAGGVAFSWTRIAVAAGLALLSYLITSR